MSKQKFTTEHFEILKTQGFSRFLLKVPVFSKFPGKVVTMTIEVFLLNITKNKKIT